MLGLFLLCCMFCVSQGGMMGMTTSTPRTTPTTPPTPTPTPMVSTDTPTVQNLHDNTILESSHVYDENEDVFEDDPDFELDQSLSERKNEQIQKFSRSIVVDPEAISFPFSFKLRRPKDIPASDDVTFTKSLGLFSPMKEVKIFSSLKHSNIIIDVSLYSDNERIQAFSLLKTLTELFELNRNSIYLTSDRIKTQTRQLIVERQSNCRAYLKSISQKLTFIQNFGASHYLPISSHLDNVCHVNYGYDLGESLESFKHLIESQDSLSQDPDMHAQTLTKNAGLTLALSNEYESILSKIYRELTSFSDELESLSNAIIHGALLSKLSSTACTDDPILELLTVQKCTTLANIFRCILDVRAAADPRTGTLMTAVHYPGFKAKLDRKFIRHPKITTTYADMSDCTYDQSIDAYLCDSLSFGSRNCFYFDGTKNFEKILEHCELEPIVNSTIRTIHTNEGHLLDQMLVDTTKIRLDKTVLNNSQMFINSGVSFTLETKTNNVFYTASSATVKKEIKLTYFTEAQLQKLRSKARANDYGFFKFLLTKGYRIGTFIYNTIVCPLVLKGFVEVFAFIYNYFVNRDDEQGGMNMRMLNPFNGPARIRHVRRDAAINNRLNDLRRLGVVV